MGWHLCTRLLEQECQVLCVDNFFTGTHRNIEPLVAVIPFVLALETEESRALRAYIPNIPGYDVPVLLVRVGEAAVHLAGACVFALVGFRKVTVGWLIPIFAAALVIFGGRAGTLTLVLPIAFAMLMLGKVRKLAAILVTGIVILFAAYTIEAAFITDYRDARGPKGSSHDAQQIVDNVVSIVSSSGNKDLEGTKQWRQEWWGIILQDTVYGPDFWTGRGFGLNLAAADGFDQRSNPNSSPLRNPHSVHMTILARAGVPGAVLWALLLASWFGAVMHAMLTARHRGQTEWAGLFLFICCYVMAIIIDASFDVAIEGPMIGIWFWCLVGFGIGSVTIYRAQFR